MRRLLIVEDEAIVRNWLVHRMRWEALGFTVAGAAENGLDALRFLEKNAVDAVITDIRMPDMDGLEMMAMLKVRQVALPVVILSGYNSFEHARKAIQLGAFEFLSKPLDEQEGKVQLHEQLFALHTLADTRAYIWMRGTQTLARIRALREAQQHNISAKAMAYIRANIEQKLALEEIAGALFLNPAYLSSTFKRESGVAMTRFINHEKVERAKRMLLEAHMSTQEVADRLGFGTYRYFCTVFKKETGISPGSFRKRNGVPGS